MNAILKMIYSSDQAKAAIKLCKKKNLMIVNKKHGLALDDEIADAGSISLNLGGYGTSFSVAIGEKFGNSWGLTDFSKRKATIYSDTGSITQWESFSTDYNEESFFVRHAYFLGASDPYNSLKTTLKAEINKEAWESLNSATSRPFPKPKSKKIAVKVINHLGDEVMKVFKVD